MGLATILSTSFGLSQYASRIYMASVQLGPSTISQIASYAGIPRTAAYSPIRELAGAGLLSSVLVNKSTRYLALPPKRLADILRSRARELSEVVSETYAGDAINDKNAGFAVQYFSGRDGMKTAAALILQESERGEWLSFEDAVTLNDFVGRAFEKDFIRTRTRKGLNLKMILALREPSPRVRLLVRQDTEHLRETRLLDGKVLPFPALVIITKTTVLLATAGRKSFAVLVRNADIVQTLTSLHRTIWNGLPALGSPK